MHRIYHHCWLCGDGVCTWVYHWLSVPAQVPRLHDMVVLLLATGPKGWGVKNCSRRCVWISWDDMVKQEILLWLIGASLSKPQTGVTSLCPCVCMFVWILLGPTLTVSHFRFLFCAYASCINSKWLESEDLNHGQSTSLTATTRMETTHRLTYSVARVIKLTAWQSVNAVCLCCLTHCSCVEVTGQSLLTCKRR